jgi:ribose transport system ATP-binding protein
MEGIGKSFPGVQALADVNFDVDAGEVHALMGENGAGKSTLMKILAGAQPADSGHVLIDGQPVQIRTPQQAMDLGIQIIYQELNLIPHLSVAENVFLGHMPRKLGWVDYRRMRQESKEILTGLGVSLDPNAIVNTLSIAQQQLVEIAKAISHKARIIAMDEPTAALTEHEQESLWRLVERLRENGVAVVYISHRMDEVFKLADRITVLRDGRTVATHRAADIDSDTLVREMVGRSLGENFPKRNPDSELPSPKRGTSVWPEGHYPSAGAPLLEIRGLTRKGILDEINLTVDAGEIVALAGLVGAGRTEIARCLFGADPIDCGEIYLKGERFIPKSPLHAIRAGIGFVTEDRKEQGLVLPMTIRENITLAALDRVSNAGAITGRRERSAAAEFVRRLDIRTPSVEQVVGNLSGGNQQKVVLAKWLFRNTKLLILDEPTRGIDIGAKVEIYRLMHDLADQGVGILMISSELPEVLGMADRIVVIREGRVAGEVPRADATQELVGRLAVGA